MISQDQLIKQFKQNPIVFYIAIGVVVFIIVVSMSSHDQESPRVMHAPDVKQKPIGLGANGIDQKAYLTQMEKSFFESQDRIKAVEVQIKKVQENQQSLSESLLKLNDFFKKQSAEKSNSSNKIKDRSAVSTIDLAVAQIAPVIVNTEINDVYLPMGSFCRGTLLTGVYATADQNNPLPVLIRLDEAFYGPNNTRIPLKGSFVIGKAYGDLVSQRALIQIIAFSSVLPNGQTFETQQNLGYVTDSQGQLGIPGIVVRNTGKQLALSFMTGFMAGGSQAMADQQVSERTTDNGSAVRNVTGNTAKHAIFSGLAKSTGKMSEYYSQQTEHLIPAIYVSNGQTIHFIVQKGVSIHGLSRFDELAFDQHR